MYNCQNMICYHKTNFGSWYGRMVFWGKSQWQINLNPQKITDSFVLFSVFITIQYLVTLPHWWQGPILVGFTHYSQPLLSMRWGSLATRISSSILREIRL